MTKMSENKHKKVGFDVELTKQSHLNLKEKEKLRSIWEKHKDLLKGKVGHRTNSKVKLRFKQGASKRHQCKHYGVAETHKKS